MTHAWIARLAASALCLPLATAALAQSSAEQIERGRQLYMANGCYSCHGTVGQGAERGGAPRLAPDPQPFEAFKIMVRQPRDAMPRLDARFVNDEQLLAMHRYLAAITKGPAAKDIAVLQVAPR